MRSQPTRRAFLASVGAVGAVAHAAGQAAVAIQPRVIDAAVRAAMDVWSVPGACVGIVHNDKVVHLQGYGVREIGTKKPVTPSTQFGVGSITKSVAAATAGILIDEKKLTWDDPVRQHVPWFRMSDPLAERAVTLRDFLCHRSGLHSRHDVLYSEARWSLEENVRHIAHLELDFPFRSTFHYCSLGYLVVATLIAAVAGKPWHVFAREKLLAPLDMTEVGFTKADWDRVENRATTHRKTESGKVVIIPPWNPVDGQIDASGRLKASGKAMCEWIRMNLNRGRRNGKRPVSQVNLDETHAPQMVVRREGFWGDVFPKAESSQMSYGLGWTIRDYRGHAVLSHAGKTDGFSAEAVLVPGSRLGFIILTNLDFTWMPEALMHTLVDLFLGLPRKDWDAFYRKLDQKEKDSARAERNERAAKQKKNTRPTLALSEYVGTYSEPAYREVRVSEKAGKLFMHWSTFEVELQHYHHDTFTITADVKKRRYVPVEFEGEEVVFILNGAAKMGELRWHGRRFQRMQTR